MNVDSASLQGTDTDIIGDNHSPFLLQTQAKPVKRLR